MKTKILSIIGTRPEAIKMCPLILALRTCKKVQLSVALSGQHKELADTVLREFGICPDYNFEVMKEGQSLADLSQSITKATKKLLTEEEFHLVMVHGDTTTAFASALAAFYSGVPIAHVEAGLRTYDTRAPYPEEFNRRAIDMISDICLAPTEAARQNLLREGVKYDKVFVTGNTGIDALFYSLKSKKPHPFPLADNKRRIMMTLHRRETGESTLREIMLNIRNTIEAFDDVEVVFPVHPNPKTREVAEEIFANSKSILLTPPIDFGDFHRLLKESYLIISDSGGIQEEATALGVPLLLIRDVTERPEAAECGNMLIGTTSPEIIAEKLTKLLGDTYYRNSFAKKSTTFGDGNASERIKHIICEKMLSNL